MIGGLEDEGCVVLMWVWEEAGGCEVGAVEVEGICYCQGGGGGGRRKGVGCEVGLWAGA